VVLDNYAWVAEGARKLIDSIASAQPKSGPLVGVIMGSQSDWATMQHATGLLEELGVAYETKIVSAHRTPARLCAYARSAKQRGLKVIIAGAGTRFPYDPNRTAIKMAHDVAYRLLGLVGRRRGASAGHDRFHDAAARVGRARQDQVRTTPPARVVP
jgi:hypothetical protein